MILDCTFRDGGYYVDWDFDESIARKYLSAVGIAKIDIVEIGFRFLQKDRFYGAFAYSSDEYLKTLPLPGGFDIAVMINSSDLIEYEDGVIHAVHKLFDNKENSPVDIVRIATRATEVEQCQKIAQEIRSLGYRVFLNLMQVDSLEDDRLREIAENVDSWGGVEVLFFADSFGNMEPDQVKNTARVMSEGWKGKTGFHSHDNKGMALSNCLAAIEAGVDIFDSTLRGMGRGAGNVKTESLLVEMLQRGYENYFPDALFPLVMQEFEELHKRYDWGHNIYYHLSAVHGIHPTYIQELLGGGIYGSDQILSAIQFLSSKSTSFYSLETMLTSISGINGVMKGEWSVSKWIQGKEVMIIGTGESTERHMLAVLRYIQKKKPIVLCLNINEVVPREIVTAYVACHETRILVESDCYSGLGRPIIMPKSRLIDPILNNIKGVEIFDYGLCVEEGAPVVTDNGCMISKPLAGLYAIAIAIAAKSERILLVGMDGYSEYDYRQREMVSMFEQFNKFEIPLVAVTPTSYPVVKRSIYEKDL